MNGYVNRPWPLVKSLSALYLGIIAIIVSLASPTHAHKLQVEPVVIILRPQTSFITVEMRGNGEDVVQAVHVRDDERGQKGDFAPSVEPRLEKYVNQKLHLSQGDLKLHGKIQLLEYWRPDPLDYTTSQFRALLRYDRPAKVASQPFRVKNGLFDYLPNAKAVLSVGGLQKNLSPGDEAEFDPSQVSANLWANIRDFAALGIEHIFTGPDHILFILALLVASSSFVPLVKTLSGFTLAHSVTLCLAALGVLSPPEKAIELLVAASIIYVGLENVFLKDFKHRFWIASAFGFVHGFGFAGVLREIGLPEEGLGWSLLSFNLGVEIGQVLICSLAFPIVMHLRKKFEHNAQYGGTSWNQAMKIASWFVVAAGGYWMLERLVG